MRTVIESVSATGGFLEKSPIKLHPGLNCLIGARGTCKSTIVESIRFAFDAEPKRVEVLLGRSTDARFVGFSNMITCTLPSGSVRCSVRDTEDRGNTCYSIERDRESPRRIYREGVKDHSEPNGIERIEIYSQGDLQRIAENESLRLELIDRPNAPQIAALRLKQNQYANELQSLGKKVRDLKTRAEQLRSQVRELPELKSQLETVRLNRPGFSRDLDEQRTLFQHRQIVLNALSGAVTVRDAVVEQLGEMQAPLSTIKGLYRQIEEQQVETSGEALDELKKLVDLFDSVLVQAGKIAEVPNASLVPHLTALFDELNEPYFQLRQREQEANESLKKEDVLKQTIEQLKELEEELSLVGRQQDLAIEKRAEIRREFQSLGDEVIRLRLKEVASINQHHATAVLLTLEPGAQSEAYTDRVQRVLQGSRLQKQDGLAKEIASLIRPADLIDLVEVGDTAGLAALLDRDVPQVTRLMSFLMDTPLLYDLEGHIFEDKLSITMYDEGQPKPVETLSKGQKATALLPLILRPASYPLIFDQPEDDLDNRFIFSSLVQTILTLKLERQIIFITHNANIPVIGEAENVVVMRMASPEQASPALHGSVDDRKHEIVELLEGGADAFAERGRRYNGMLI